MTDQPTTQPADTGSAAPPPDAQADELEGLAKVILHGGPLMTWESSSPGLPQGFTRWTTLVQARAVLAYLAPRLVPAAAEERVEWGYRTPNVLDSHAVWSNYGARESTARTDAAALGVALHRRTVRTWETADGATGTLVGPWVEEAPRG